MSEYIIHYKDAETLYEHKDFPFLLDEYLREEIVRCRDCINLEHWKFKDGSERLVCCMIDVHDVSEDDFCSQGERKENGC